MTPMCVVGGCYDPCVCVCGGGGGSEICPAILFYISQSELPGFYDPCVGEEKQLSITYHFRRQLHTCKFNEKEKILIPNRSE